MFNYSTHCSVLGENPMIFHGAILHLLVDPSKGAKECGQMVQPVESVQLRGIVFHSCSLRQMKDCPGRVSVLNEDFTWGQAKRPRLSMAQMERMREVIQDRTVPPAEEQREL